MKVHPGWGRPAGTDMTPSERERERLRKMLQDADKRHQLSKQHMMDVKAEMRRRKGIRA